MGIIAGLKASADQSTMAEKIITMFQSQSHRDKQKPLIYETSNLAIGMANKHDTIFCNGVESKSEQSNYKYNGINAFIDGIVLEVPKLKKYLEDHGKKVPVPRCSSIVEAAYEKWGLDFMSHLEGEFACAVWDDNHNTLILARDPYGHKPIHYYYDGHQFVFSSEIKGVLKAGVKREIDMKSLSDFLSLNCIPYPSTIFKGIYQVPPGSMLIFKNNEISIKSYWSHVGGKDASISLDDAVKMASDRIQAAVKKRMIEKDTYCFLSGGIDSSAILSFASEISDKNVHAVTVGFEEAEEDELEDAARMAKHVGAQHHQVIATPDTFFDMLETLVFHHDSPFTDTSAYPTYFAGKLAGKYTDIILTGDGPDQSMGGSGHHVFALKNNMFSKRNKFVQLACSAGSKIFSSFYNEPIPSFFSKIGRKFYRDSLTPVRAVYDVRSYFPDIVKKYMCNEKLWQVHEENCPFGHPDNWFEKAKDMDIINRYLYADMVFYVPDDLMIKVDRMCMAHGLETLSPFQDLGVASIINQLPGSYKINMTTNGEINTKFILKKVCEDRFPKQTLNKKKQGFGIPLDKWLRQDNGKVIKDILLDPMTLNRGYFKKTSLEKFVGAFISNKGDWFYPSQSGVVGLLTLELWHRKYLN